MAKEKRSPVFVCSSCGRESLRWEGRCPQCQQWNTLVETAVSVRTATSMTSAGQPPEELSRIETGVSERLPLPIGEFNRVLGGGIVPGSLVLIGGEPGIGKSTLLLQAAAAMAEGGKVVYVSGEETRAQIKLRAQRLGLKGNNIYILTETDIEAIVGHLEQLAPQMAIIDSIQSVYLPGVESSPGSITQVRECTLRLMQEAKSHSLPILITGHVTKDGAIAGPRVLEHIVDAVLYLEGEQFSSFRILRGVKNRFGSTNEVGVFEMRGQGLEEVSNPSLAFLSQRSEETVGSTVVPTLEGTRPLLVEVQALTTPTAFGLPRRTANGVDFNRLLLIAAVLTRRVGLRLGNQDIITNVTGGIRIAEPGADLGLALAIASSCRDQPVDRQMVAVGEVGLSGELRSVSQLERRVDEAARLGFQRCLVPRSGLKGLTNTTAIKIIPASTLKEAVYLGLGTTTEKGEG